MIVLFLYFSEIKWLREHFEATTYVCMYVYVVASIYNCIYNYTYNWNFRIYDDNARISKQSFKKLLDCTKF